MSEVRDNAGEQRFELAEGGQIAFAAYRLDGSTITFTHTIVPRELEGQGIGSRLVAAALDDARSQGRRVIAQCSFVAGFVDRHPEYRDLLA
jgi:predicted GNAT family acetyltransferase